MTMMTIASVEAETGIPKDTLRVWERRYRFPQPERDPHGERLYPEEQVAHLRLVKRLLNQGLRPGRLLAMDVTELLALVEQESRTSVPRTAFHEFAFDLLKTHQADQLRRELAQVQMREGVERFVLDIASPMCTQVGDAWAHGEIQVYEEHLFTEVLQSVLRQAIAQIGRSSGWPRILITTLPDERHGLGLLMAEAIATLGGAHCISLGTQTPIQDIALAAQSQRADVVGLSISAETSALRVRESVALLRTQLPRTVSLWCGGKGALRLRRPDDGVEVVEALDALGPAIAAWREGRQAGAPGENADH